MGPGGYCHFLHLFLRLRSRESEEVIFTNVLYRTTDAIHEDGQASLLLEGVLLHHAGRGVADVVAVVEL